MGCATSDASLEFRNGQDRLFRKSLTSGYSEIFLWQDLKPVPDWCLGDLNVTYQAAPYKRTRLAELDLFAQDPVNFKRASLV